MLSIQRQAGYKPLPPSKLPTGKPSDEQVRLAQMVLDSARVRILQHPSFLTFSGVIACGSVYLDHKTETAETDGWNVWYNPHMVLDFAKAGRAYVNALVLHECWHKAFHHAGERTPYLNLWEADESMFLWASDVFINTALTQIDEETQKKSARSEPFIAWPAWAIQPREDMRGKSTAEIFKFGMEAKRRIKEWLDKELEGKYQDAVKRMGPSTEVIQKGKTPANPQAVIQREILAASTSNNVLKSLRGRGTESGSELAESLLGRLTKPKISYVELMRDWIRQTNVPGNGFSSWTRINRKHLASGTYMPGTMSREGGVLGIEIDTSGSCWDEVPDFLSELQGVIEQVKPFEVHVFWVDSSLKRLDALKGRRLQELDQLQPSGRGGTDMRVIFREVKERKLRLDGIIVFTDGETPYPTEEEVDNVPTLWVISSRHYVSPVGTTVYLDVNV